MSRLRLAVAQYPVGEPANWQQAAEKLRRWVAEAAGAGAELLVFPEYAAMELAAVFAPKLRASLTGQLQALQGLLPEYLALHRTLAVEHGVHLLAGSFPVQLGDGRFVNRAHVFSPQGMGWQDKQIMTRFEREEWGITSAPGLKLFDTAIGRFGICTCYDIEFPLLARALAEAGAQVILAPSCTDTVAGYWRVRLGAQARALENQCIVVQAPLVGEAAWSPAVDVNLGRAGVFAPPDRGLPDDGVLALGEWNQPQWLHAELDLAALDAVRREGQVLNHRDWAEQPALPLPPVERVIL